MYINNFDRRKQRLRKKLVKVSGDKLRLIVYISNMHIYAQLIDDSASITIASASTKDKEFSKKVNTSTVAAASEVGKLIAEKAKKAIGKRGIYFDRGGYLFHGRVKAVAEGARTAGLKF